ncbi:hypothetical protein ES288_A05G417100v1 [Gossypium darwinii]|uniref:Uncharacterized protein n=1 Tax=Gossypium darwinii TaxID=34276 RepID=A0A5D2GQP3_GOSDA|nr:hypothetical protein ES288_A05G417100v1 [Gossypium darwinii]
MTELVTLKQHGTVGQFHDGFFSLLNQLYLHESYALSIFINNLKTEIGQYLRLFKPQTLVEGYNLAWQVKNIVLGPVKKGFTVGSASSSSRPLFPISRGQQGTWNSPLAGGW